MQTLILTSITYKTKQKIKRVMKRKLLSIMAVVGMMAAANAQDDKVYTPVAGDWAIGIDATPFLNYAGNFFGKTANNNAPTWNFQTTNQTITGKYFASDDMAYRGSLRIGFGSWTDNNMVVNLADTAINNNVAFPDLLSMTENSMKMSYSNIGLSGGIEMRKGSGRLIGIYGAELGFSVSSSKAAYTYGNALALNPGDTTVFVNVNGQDNFGSNLTSDTYGNFARVTEQNFGRTFTFGLRAFIGAEYFIFPKISLGGEFGWGLGFSSTTGGSVTMESIGDTGTNTDAGSDIFAIGQQTIENSGSSSFRLDTDNVNTMFAPSGSLRLTFHF